MVRIVKSPDQRRMEIVETACQVFLQKGYESTTMQDIMQRLGIAKGTIYHYFRSKDELLDAVLDLILDVEHRRLQEVSAELTGYALERMKTLIFTISYGNHNHEFIENLHKPGNAGMHIRLHAKSLLLLSPFFAETVQLGVEEGIFNTKYPLECAEFILAATTFLTDMGIYPWSGSQLKRRIQAMPSLIEQQLGARKGSFDFLRHTLEKGMQQLQDPESRL